MTHEAELGMAATRLRAPARPNRLVERDRLDALLDAAIAAKVPFVLVSAPAGSGKSTMLAAWAARREEAVAWLQVEPDDADPARFWSAVAAAMAQQRPALAARVAPVVVGSAGDERTVVPALVNAVLDGDEPLVLVIDDFHLIEDPSVHRGVERLIDLSPPQLTVVIATRVDPPFRLGRMRVRDRVREVRAHDLRFADDEAAALLGTTGEALSPESVTDLCTRTEGWAAGLVLAGLSMERAAEPARFVATFRGDDQLVVGYLGDELLATMDPADRQRMLAISVVERFNGALVDAVTTGSTGAAWLHDMAARNQLIVRLDNTGEWFRFHHLLRDLLALEATRSFADELPAFHRRAAEWFVIAGDHSLAVAHFIASGDVARAMMQMRVVGPDLLGRGQVRTLQHLLEQFGTAAESDAVCSLLWGWCHYLDGRYATAQQWLDSAIAAWPQEFDPMLAVPLRINVALGSGDVGTALSLARTVTALDDLPTRPAELATAVGAAYLWAGLPTEARSALEVAVARARVEHRFTAHTMSLVSVAIAEMEDGSPAAAFAAAELAIATAESFGLAGYHGVAPAYAVLARTASEPARRRVTGDRAVELARRATTDLGKAFVLVTVGDALLDIGDDAEGGSAGAELLREARAIVERCVDPGIVARSLDRVESRHRLATVVRDASTQRFEQLTDREVAVLRHLPTQLTLREIAAELYLSANTVKTHCAAIYRKLEVTDRKSAVLAARQRGLL